MARARIRTDEAEIAPFSVETPGGGGHEPLTPNFAGTAGTVGRGNPMKDQALWMTICVLGLGLIAVGILKLLYGRRMAPGLDLAKSDDLWAIHDLLLAGYAGIFMKPDSAGLLEAQTASKKLAALLPAIHPLERCRERFAQILGGTAGSPVLTEVTNDMHMDVTSEAWRCLALVEEEFKDPFLPNAIGNFEAYKAAKMTVPKRTLNGVCGRSAWPRTCSYWVSMHLLAARADLLQLGHQLLDALVPILAGGATFCGGCTKHFRALTQPMLSPALVQDFSNVFCSGPQCGAAVRHMRKLQPCLDLQDPLQCDETDLLEEIGDILNFRKLLKSLPLPPAANATGPAKSLSFTVLGVLHNLVTYTVSEDYTTPGRRAFFCVVQAQTEARAFWSLLDDPTAEAISQLGITDYGVDGLPGLATSKEPHCPELV